MAICRYGTGDFTLGRLLEWASGGKWEFVWAQQWFTMTDQLNMGVSEGGGGEREALLSCHMAWK